MDRGTTIDDLLLEGDCEFSLQLMAISNSSISLVLFS
jgi:hypothetical protein